MRTATTAADNSSLGTVVTLVGATLDLAMTSEQWICPDLLIALR